VGKVVLSLAHEIQVMSQSHATKACSRAGALDPVAPVCLIRLTPGPALGPLVEVRQRALQIHEV
jgi:hypothetical protein